MHEKPSIPEGTCTETALCRAEGRDLRGLQKVLDEAETTLLQGTAKGIYDAASEFGKRVLQSDVGKADSALVESIDKLRDLSYGNAAKSKAWSSELKNTAPLAALVKAAKQDGLYDLDEIKLNAGWWC